MSKALKRIVVAVLAVALVLCAVPAGAGSTVKAAEYDGDIEVYIGFGGDVAEENDWGYQFNDPNNAGNAGDIVAETATAKVGDTVTVSLTFPSAVVNTWWMAPVLVAENVSNVDAEVSLKIDGADVEIDAAAGDAWWYEATGDYTDTQAIRLYGGFNEWGTQYIAEPSGFTTVEYTITINSVEVSDGEAAAVESAEFDGEAEVYIGFGGDVAEENDWGYQFNDPNNAGNAGDIVAETATAKVGDTVTVSLTFPSAVVNTWWMAPVVVAEGVTDLDATVSLKIDGADVEIDAAAGDAWWYEATGDYTDTQAVRLYGGFNEWGTQYIAEPSGFTTVEYTITINSMMVGSAASATDAEEASEETVGEVDLDGTYNAYLLIQTPKWSFRNAYDEQFYGYNGENGSEFFNQITGWTDDGEAFAVPCTLKDAEITGNGTYTVGAYDIEWADDEFDTSQGNDQLLNQIAISTDIPNTGDITISDVSLKIDGSTVSLSAAGAIPNEESVNYLQIMLLNIWNEDTGSIGYFNTPFSSIEITFTVSGFNYDNEAAAEEETEEATEEATESSDDTAAAEETTEAAAEESSGLSGGAIAGIIAAIVAVIAVVTGVAVGKKKKDN